MVKFIKNTLNWFNKNKKDNKSYSPMTALEKAGIKRRSHTEKYLKKLKIPINKHLPLIIQQSAPQLRNTQEVATRAIILISLILVSSEENTPDEATTYLKKFHLWDKTTPNEKLFLKNCTQDERKEMSWKIECLYVLLWSLGLVDTLNFPDKEFSIHDLTQEVRAQIPRQLQDPTHFTNTHHQCKTVEDILNTLDLYYRMHWACRDAYLNGETIHTLNNSVIYERHFALNWLETKHHFDEEEESYYPNDWDDVTCDT